jgi:hypothetical protein
MTDTPNRRKIRMKDADFLLAKEMEAIDVECRQRITKIRQNSHMKDVVQLAQVPLSESLRPIASEIRALHQLAEAAELRMRELLDGHLVEMRAQRDLRALEQLRSHFQHREWIHLKGVYPLLQRNAEIESEKLIVRLEYETDVRRKKRPGR